MASRPKTRKRARRPRTETPPNWPKLRTRFKALERGLEAKLLPSLKRARRKLEGLIAQLENRV